MAEIIFNSVNKVFADGTRAVRDVTLRTTDGEFLVLVGPSGCGKSTLLRMIAGLEEISSGEIRIGPQLVNHLPPQERDVAMVFQDYALYPHLSVRNNLAFPLKMAGVARAERNRRVEATARLLGLEDLLARRPGQLSGGQRQRVAMGRALVREPAVFLLDEPLSNLDAKLRVQMRGEITALQRRLKTTTIFVTHDQVEAMTMGDRLAVLYRGQLQQVGTPAEVYHQPANVFVATFIGSPAMNLFWTTLETNAAGEGTLSFGGRRLPLPPAMVAAVREKFGGAQFLCGLRPECFCAPDQSGALSVDVEIAAVELMGHEQIVHFRTDVEPLSAAQIGRLSSPLPDAAPAQDAESSTASFAARLSPDVPVRAGQAAKLGIALRGVCLFNPQGNAFPLPGERRQAGTMR